jgi:hypothetical protein
MFDIHFFNINCDFINLISKFRVLLARKEIEAFREEMQRMESKELEVQSGRLASTVIVAIVLCHVYHLDIEILENL